MEQEPFSDLLPARKPKASDAETSGAAAHANGAEHDRKSDGVKKDKDDDDFWRPGGAPLGAGRQASDTPSRPAPMRHDDVHEMEAIVQRCVERTMQRFVGGLKDVLADMSRRLASLETACSDIHAALGSVSETEMMRGETLQEKLGQVDSRVREISATVQAMKDKQGILEAQDELKAVALAATPQSEEPAPAAPAPAPPSPSPSMPQGGGVAASQAPSGPPPQPYQAPPPPPPQHMPHHPGHHPHHTAPPPNPPPHHAHHQPPPPAYPPRPPSPHGSIASASTQRDHVPQSSAGYAAGMHGSPYAPPAPWPQHAYGAPDAAPPPPQAPHHHYAPPPPQPGPSVPYGARPGHDAGPAHRNAPPPASGTRVTLDRLVDDIAAMGFAPFEVREVVQPMMARGEKIDVNVVIDKLSSRAAGGGAGGGGGRYR
ncbi:unnamed protein product [Pedinophyceae sp. YPF-701]|nr:unnamed protein product [Pedinophyceae sp. YPF-701]